MGHCKGGAPTARKMTKLGYCLLVLLVFVVAEDSSLRDTDVANIAASGEILQHSVVKRDVRKKMKGSKKRGKRGGRKGNRSKRVNRGRTPEKKKKAIRKKKKKKKKKTSRKKEKGKKKGRKG